MEIWYTKQGKNATAEKLTDEDWDHIGDMVDILGAFKPLTIDLQDRTKPHIVHLLPELLSLLTSKLQKPSRSSSRFSGRSLEDYQTLCGLPGETDLAKLVTPF